MTTTTSPPTTTASTTTTIGVAEVPNVVGLGLQQAQDLLQSKGFFSLTSHDSLGFGRTQVLDSNWVVTDQNLRPGSVVPVDTLIDLGVKKVGD